MLEQTGPLSTALAIAVEVEEAARQVGAGAVQQDKAIVVAMARAVVPLVMVVVAAAVVDRVEHIAVGQAWRPRSQDHL